MKTLIPVFLVIMLAAVASAQVTDPTGDAMVQHRRDLPALDARTAGSLDETYTHVEPGIAPEGDYLGGAAFTPDGDRVLICNRMTDNVTVFNWETMEPLASIHVGRYPAAVIATDSIAVVACVFANKVYFVDLTTYTVLDSLDSGEQPWVLHFSPDSETVYAACDISNTCEVYDLATRTHVRTLDNFPIWLYTFSWNSASGRNDAVFTNYVVSPDGQYLIAANATGNIGSVLFINAITGVVEDSLTGFNGNPVFGLSGDNSKLIVVTPMTPSVAYQVDVATHTILDSVTIAGHSLSMSYQVAVNEDGSKCFTGVDNNVSVIVRFATHDVTTISTTLTAFWVGVTPDHQYAVSGQYNFCLVDFATETVVSHLTGRSQWHGIVSPAGDRVAALDPFNFEGPMFYDISTPSNTAYLGRTPSGQTPEGDAPRYVAIAADGSKAVTSNFLSDNVTIINLATLETEAIVSAGSTPWEIGISPDSRYAVLGGCTSSSVPVIDLELDSVVADVPVSGRPVNVSFSPDGGTAYVACLVANAVSVIQINGENSTEIATVPTPGLGVLWASYGVSAGVAVSPSGRWVLVAAVMNDVVHVIDTQINEVVATLSVGDIPIQIAFAGNDSEAVVANFGGNSVSRLHIDGDLSTVAGTYSMGNSSGPLRLAYDAYTDEIGVGLYSAMQVKKINPHTGTVTATHNFTTYGPVASVAYDQAGNEVVLTSGTGTVSAMLHRGPDHTELPGGPASAALQYTGRFAAVAIPGPDYVSVIDYGEMGTPLRNIPVSRNFGITATYPNPFNPAVTIRYSLPKNADVSLRAFDALGREAAVLFSGRQNSGDHEMLWNAAALPSGPYWIRLEAGTTRTVRKVLLLK